MALVPSRSAAALSAHRVVIRIDLTGGARIGPGKVALLEAIADTGSIAAAARGLRMSYRRAWELVEDLNRTLGTPAVVTSAGGRSGGGARLTEAGRVVVAEYRALEAEATAAATARLAALERVCAATAVPAGEEKSG